MSHLRLAHVIQLHKYMCIIISYVALNCEVVSQDRVLLILANWADPTDIFKSIS